MIWQKQLRAFALALLGLGVLGALGVAGEKAFDEPPIPVKMVPPMHPYDLKREGIGGMVSLSIIVDVNGNVQEPTVQKSTNPAFERPALEAVSKWKFKAAKKDGQAVAVKVVVPVKFNVSD
jgi:periplasmic protein TonB